uniref:ATPase AAA-type core domain-containing protein n=1 Tax=Anopheles culicifacies TaxID=139723 RepID=A0A182LUM9_9DIPT
MEHALRRSMLLIRGQPGKSDHLQDILFDTAIKYTHTGFRVLFFTQKPLERVSSSIREQFSDLFKMITFVYVETLDAALKRLLDLQRWTNCIPGLIIVESFDLLATSNPNDKQNKQDFQRVLFLATLADTVRTISVNQKGTCNSIVSLNNGTLTTVPFEMYYREHNVLDMDHIKESSDILSIMMENEHSIESNLA